MKDLSQISEQELEQLLAQKREASRLLKEKQRQDYEALKNQTITELCQGAIEYSEALKVFKVKSFESMQALYAMLQEYSKRHTDGKGNFTIEYNNFKIRYKRQGKVTFDERSHQAEKHIIDFVNSKFDNDPDTRDLIMSLLERKKGELEINLVQKLYSMEDRFDNENWKLGISLLKESYSYSHSKDYIGFEFRNANNAWETINLQFSSI